MSSKSIGGSVWTRLRSMKPFFMRAQKSRCLHCGNVMEEIPSKIRRVKKTHATYDHIIPCCFIPHGTRLAGKKRVAMSNFFLCCRGCNGNRGNKTLDELYPCPKKYTEFLKQIKAIQKEVFEEYYSLYSKRL